jgi:dienelactone hydrolase
VLLAIGVLAAVALAGTAYLLRDPMPHFRARRGTLSNVTEQATTVAGGYATKGARVTSTSGLSLELAVRRPLADTGKRLPMAIVLGGHVTGREAARLVGDVPGVIVAALSYPFEGDPRPSAATFLREIPKIRSAFLDTPPAIQLALDYLMTVPGVDTTRMELIGVSLGAPFVCIAGALDARVSRVWVLHGSGGSYGPLEANMRREIGFAPLRAVAATVANVIIAGPRLDPVHWVDRIAPRPFMMVNASGDERLPREGVDALFAAAREPKELMWMEGAHIHADSATISRLVDIVMERVRR